MEITWVDTENDIKMKFLEGYEMKTIDIMFGEDVGEWCEGGRIAGGDDEDAVVSSFFRKTDENLG